MTYLLTFKGEIDPIILDDHKGIKLLDDWSNGKLPETVRINDTAFSRSAIKAVVKQHHDSSKDDNREKLMDDIRTYHTMHLYQRSQSPETKAQHSPLPTTIYWVHTGTPLVPEALQAHIDERQIAFFKDNPQRIHADPACYRDLLPRPRNGSEMRVRMASAAMRAITEAIRQDERESQF